MDMSQSFTKYAVGEKTSFKYANGISSSSGKEFHLFHEMVLFLGGNVEMISETVHIKLKPHTLIVIPKETYHQFVINGKKDEYCRCVFQFDDDISELKKMIDEGMQELFITESDSKIDYLFSKLIEQTEDESFSNETLKATLVLLLKEIHTRKSLEIDVNLTDELTKLAIKYITENLTSNISSEEIAKALNVSVSTLMHTFKKNMNISIYKYIIKKRLILAHIKISKGESATSVATECGFNDYSGFYRQYKKMFDKTPSLSTRN